MNLTLLVSVTMLPNVHVLYKDDYAFPVTFPNSNMSYLAWKHITRYETDKKYDEGVDASTNTSVIVPFANTTLFDGSPISYRNDSPIYYNLRINGDIAVNPYYGTGLKITWHRTTTIEFKLLIYIQQLITTPLANICLRDCFTKYVHKLID